MNGILRNGLKYLFSIGEIEEKELEFFEEKGGFELKGKIELNNGIIEKGIKQLGTIGQGNHFLEMSLVESPNEMENKKFLENEIIFKVHTGSRGLGFDLVQEFLKGKDKKFFKFNSKGGKEYFQIMKIASNFAWVNRFLLFKIVKREFNKFFGKDLEVFVDHSHNLASVEFIEGEKKIIHRKGASKIFRKDGKIYPTVLPGDMIRGSYIVLGSERLLKETHGSICHGAGREYSRRESMKKFRIGELKKMISEKGILLDIKNRKIIEEFPKAYKDLNWIMKYLEKNKFIDNSIFLKPILCIKG